MSDVAGNFRIGLQALQTGKRLENVTGWKWAGLACLAVAFGVPAAVDFLAAFTWYPDWLPQQLDGLYLLSIVSAYAQVATTEKIGIGRRTAAPAADGMFTDPDTLGRNPATGLPTSPGRDSGGSPARCHGHQRRNGYDALDGWGNDD